MAFHENLFADLIMLVSFTRCYPLCLLIFLLVLPSSSIFTMNKEKSIHKEDLAIIKLTLLLMKIKVFFYCNNNSIASSMPNFSHHHTIFPLALIIYACNFISGTMLNSLQPFFWMNERKFNYCSYLSLNGLHAFH